MDHIGVFLAQRQGEGHVLINGHVPVQRIVLENHGHIPVLCGRLGDIPSVQQQMSRGNILQPGHHPQGGALSASGGAYQHNQLAVLHVHVEVENGLHLVVIDFIQVLQFQLSHYAASFPMVPICFARASAFRWLISAAAIRHAALPAR